MAPANACRPFTTSSVRLRRIGTMTDSTAEYTPAGEEQLCMEELELREAPKQRDWRFFGGAALVAVLVILLVCTGAVVTTLLFVDICVSDSSAKATTDLRISEEYQVSLYPDHWKTNDKRKDMARTFLSVINEHWGTELEYGSGEKSIRQQYYYSLKGDDKCGSKYTARVREYIKGDSNGLKYIDLKYSDKKEDRACSAPIYPADSSPFNLFDKDSYHTKCEHDVHPCHTKYSMEARMPLAEHVDEMVKLSTCDDLGLLFPWALQSMDDRQRFNKIDAGRKTYWWVLSFEGFIDENGPVSSKEAKERRGTSKEATKIKCDFTLEYGSPSAAASGVDAPSNSSEWSAKIRARSDGTYDEKIRERTQALYDDMLQRFGSKGDLEDGVCKEE